MNVNPRTPRATLVGLLALIALALVVMLVVINSPGRAEHRIDDIVKVHTP